MSWAAEQSQAVLTALEGAFDDEVAVAAAAVDRDGSIATARTGCPVDARFEIGSVTKAMTATLLALVVG